MRWSTGVRKVHRWTAVVFTMTAIFVIAAINIGQEEPAEWVYLLPLLPLAVLFFTGLFLWLLPYSAQLRERRTTGG